MCTNLASSLQKTAREKRPDWGAQQSFTPSLHNILTGFHCICDLKVAASPGQVADQVQLCRSPADVADATARTERNPTAAVVIARAPEARDRQYMVRLRGIDQM